MKNKDIALQEALETYLEGLQKAGKSERTLYTYRKDCEQIQSFFGLNRQLNSILLPQVGKFFKSDELLSLPNGQARAAQTVNKTIRVFRMFMIWAKESGYVERLPLPKSTPMGRSCKAPTI
jgi:site-specific recombinase XerD